MLRTKENVWGGGALTKNMSYNADKKGGINDRNTNMLRNKILFGRNEIVGIYDGTNYLFRYFRNTILSYRDNISFGRTFIPLFRNDIVILLN